MKLLFVHSPTCRTCRNQAEELGKEAAGYDIERVDVTTADTAPLMRRYRITDVPTIIAVTSEGQCVKKWVDFTRFNEIRAFIGTSAG